MGTAAPTPPIGTRAAVAGPALLSLRDVEVERGGRRVLAVDHLEVRGGETLVLLGPNGAGKTTLLQVLALLIEPRRGEVLFRGSAVDSHDPVGLRRRMAVVFQQPLLLDRGVLENVALGLALRGVPREVRLARARRALQQVGIAHLAARHARGLSGGEAQRVSLARALALDPEVLLLDEPFSGLDAPTRELLLADVARLLRVSPLASVIVTHDRDEALSLADRVAVVIRGTVRQIDTPDIVFGDPADAEVAAFVGIETVLPARVVSSDDEITMLRVGEHLVHVTAAVPQHDDFPLLCIRPDDVAISTGPSDSSSARNRFAARITALEPIGRYVRVVLDCGFPLIAHLTRQSVRELGLQIGNEVVASFKATAPHLLPRRRGSALPEQSAPPEQAHARLP